MTRAERFAWILEQEEKLRRRRFEMELERAKHENRERQLHLGVSLITTLHQINVQLAIGALLR